MKKPLIGLSFSGGGFRAASFSLGVMSYLNKVQIEDRTLLTHIVSLSTVSGGTITGSRYAVGIKNNEPFNKIYLDLYQFLTCNEIVSKAIKRLLSQKGWPENRMKSLINAFADIYDSDLFSNDHFGALIKDEPKIHLKHISFNATEFSNALQFRFQISETDDNLKEGIPKKGIIGNYKIRLNEELASHIRMADILASSSCFPGGFEPIVFPDDFVINEEIVSKNFKEPSVGLMDGGIVDNQGIEPLILSEKRMIRKFYGEKPRETDTAMDLIIVCDVTSPYMEDFIAKRQKEPKSWRKLSWEKIAAISSVTIMLALSFLFYSIENSIVWLTVLTSLIASISLLFIYLGWSIARLPEVLNLNRLFWNPITSFLKLNFQVLENMALNRMNSLLKMSNDVFLKHVRRLNYAKIYDSPYWENKRIMCAIYELRSHEERLKKKIKDDQIPDFLVPSEKIYHISEKLVQWEQHCGSQIRS